MIESSGTRISSSEYDRIAEVFPEIARIENRLLRDQVAAVWTRTWEMSGYTDIHEAVFAPHLANRSLISHIRSVTGSAIGIAESLAAVHGMDIDMDRLIAAALLHDAAKCIEYERREDGTYHRSEAGKNYPHSYLVIEIGRQIGVPEDVNHLVAQHSPSAPLIPRYLEGVILNHADLVDSDCMHFAAGVLNERVRKGLPISLTADIFESA